MKQKVTCFFSLLFYIILLFSAGITVLASGDGNFDGGGGGMGNGSSSNYWKNQDGVRVTVVTTKGSIVTASLDLSNYSIADQTISFGKVSKIKYTNGTQLSANVIYTCSQPGIALPRIISSGNSKANMEAIRRYFCSEFAAKIVANKTGIAYVDLISGSYKLVIEPIAYFVHDGFNYAMTATEAALYNYNYGGALRKKLPSLTHQNLPLSIFLEKPDLGYPAWKGTTSSKVSDSDILNALGIGIVSYQDIPEADLQAHDYTYRVNTDVITSITLNSDIEVNPDHPASVTFSINGSTYTVNDIVIPAGSSQVVWAKWHTPSSPATLTIQVSVRGATTAKTSLTARIISLEENLPPDPLATDINPRFRVPSLPADQQSTTKSWSVWSAVWHENWVWESDWNWEDGSHTSGCADTCTSSHGHWVDHGEWVDNGWYDFTAASYGASLSASMEIHPDDIVPTAFGDSMKSGYGIKETVSARLSVNAPESHYAPAQTAVSYFPEFSYKNFWRLLRLSSGRNASFTFRENEYSTYNRQVHFTPVWYPDGVPYTVYTYVIDAWTPSGMLSINLNDSVQIQGSLYDDWYTKRE